MVNLLADRTRLCPALFALSSLRCSRRRCRIMYGDRAFAIVILKRRSVERRDATCKVKEYNVETREHSGNNYLDSGWFNKGNRLLQLVFAFLLCFASDAGSREHRFFTSLLITIPQTKKCTRVLLILSAILLIGRKLHCHFSSGTHSIYNTDARYCAIDHSNSALCPCIYFSID